jgi:hypothetical protein
MKTTRELTQEEAQVQVDTLVEQAVSAQSIKMIEYKALLTMKEDMLRSRFTKVLIAVTQSATILLIAAISLAATVGIGLLIKYAIWGS